MSDPRRRILHNPFYVLGLPVQASRAEIEREGQKLLGMLALGMSSVRAYDTPLGPEPRTPEAVREAMAELRDPERRLIHELCARVPASGAPADERAAAPPGGPADGPVTRPWPDALAILGFGAAAPRRQGS